MTETTQTAPRGYPNVVRAVAETAWAITAPALATILEVVNLRSAGHRFTDDELRIRLGTNYVPHRDAVVVDVQAAGGRGGGSRGAGAIAVLPLYGVMIPRATSFSRMSGGTSCEEFGAAFAQAMNDPAVGSILIDVSSPGGSADLVPELADQVYNARGKKPVVAIANPMAASGAYWVASQADELWVTKSGRVGSIGVFAAHQDISRALELEGVKTTLISAGRFKTEGNPFEPLSDEAYQAIKASIDNVYGMFLAAVARGRGATVAQVRAGFGEGRLLDSTQAPGENMVDGVATFDQVVARMARGEVGSGPTGGARADASSAIELRVARAAAAAADVDDDPELEPEPDPELDPEPDDEPELDPELEPEDALEASHQTSPALAGVTTQEPVRFLHRRAVRAAIKSREALQ